MENKVKTRKAVLMVITHGVQVISIIKNFRESGRKEIGMEKIRPGYHWECKYCDYTRGVPYHDEPDFFVCGRCGAEWEDCKILVKDEAYDY